MGLQNTIVIKYTKTDTVWYHTWNKIRKYKWIYLQNWNLIDIENKLWLTKGKQVGEGKIRSVGLMIHTATYKIDKKQWLTI